jgi:hypothetical protein
MGISFQTGYFKYAANIACEQKITDSKKPVSLIRAKGKQVKTGKDRYLPPV